MKRTAIWALDESYKVNPVNGAILEIDGTGYTRRAGHDYRAGNPVWAPDSGKVLLRAGRNETAGFQVMVPASVFSRGPARLDMQGPPASPGGPFLVRAFREWYVRVGSAWYADALIPLPFGGPFSLSSPDNRVLKQKWQGFYFEIFVPPSARPGPARFRFKFHPARAGSFEFTVSLTVLPLTLPSRPSFTLEFNSYGDFEMPVPRKVMTYQERLPSMETRAYEKKMLAYHRIARDHYGCLNALFYSQNGFYSPLFVPRLDAGARITDFTPWDRKFGPYLSGKAFTEGYGAGVPVAILYLPFSLTWPAPYHWFPSEQYLSAITEAAKAFEKHLRSKGWTKTDCQLMLNHKSRRSVFPFNCDEPTRIKDFGVLRYYGSAFKKGLSKRDPLLSFRFDIGHYECTHVMDECDQLPGETKCFHRDQMDGITGLNVVSLGHANKASFDRRRKKGERCWVYQGASWINRPLPEMAQVLFSAYAMSATGYCDWCINAWGMEDPWQSADKSFGFNYLVYPGRSMGLEGPLPSLRMKMARRAIMDIEYLEMLGKKGPACARKADRLLEKVVGGFDGDRISLMDDMRVEKMPLPVVRKGYWENFRESLKSALLRRA